MCSFMDEDPAHYSPYNFQNWGYYEQPPPRALGLQLMTSFETKPCLDSRDPNAMMINANGGFHPRVPNPALAMKNYGRDAWASRDNKFVGVVSPGASFSPGFPESSGGHSLQMLQPQNPTGDERLVKVEEPSVVKEASQSRRRRDGGASKTPKAKKTKKPKENGNSTVQRMKVPKKSMEVVINGIDMDISGIPLPVCSCTGVPQQCYRWGCGGWQSACCTTNVSTYPLPMSTKRRGARIAGRKMSQGAFKKVLEKLAAEGYNFTNSIDLKTYWAKHGTNKFVTIR